MEMIKLSNSLIVRTPFLAGGYSGTVSLPFCDKVCNPFPWVISVKMLPQQLDKSCVLGYTKSAKAMSKLQFWHKRKIPLERTAFSLLGNFPAWGVLTAYQSVHQATCKGRKNIKNDIAKPWAVWYTVCTERYDTAQGNTEKSPPLRDGSSLGGTFCMGRAYRSEPCRSSHLQT